MIACILNGTIFKAMRTYALTFLFVIMIILDFPASNADSTHTYVTWTTQNDIANISISIDNLNKQQWVAFGLSIDKAMTETHFFICKRTIDNTISMEHTANLSEPTSSISSRHIPNLQKEFKITGTEFKNNVARCEFVLSDIPNKRSKRFPMITFLRDTPFYPSISVGNLDSTNGHMERTKSVIHSKNIRLRRQGQVSYKASSGDSDNPILKRYMKAHAILMIFSWMHLIPIGILLPLFYKRTFGEPKLCGEHSWFALHRAIMSLAFISIIASLILVLFHEQGQWISTDEKVQYSHSIIGIVAICFAIIQPIMALFRCHPKTKYRPIFNYIHGIVGISAFILSIATIFVAMFFDQFTLQTNKVWIVLIIWTTWIVGICLVLGIIRYYVKSRPLRNGGSEDSHAQELFVKVVSHNGNRNTSKIAPAPIQSERITTQTETNIDESKKCRIIKYSLLGLHSIIALALGLTLMILVALQ